MRTKEELDSILREHRKNTSSKGPLSNLRVIDMSTLIAAPSAAALLGDNGAEVIKIENPNIPDGIRGWGVNKETGISSFWSILGRNKFPITLNLKADEGKETLLKLIEESDVLIENMRPGALEKLGLSHEVMLQRNPGLVIGTVSGYGKTGPNSSLPGFGTLAEGYSGFTYLNAQPGGQPTNAPLALADYFVGVNLSFAVMIALTKATRGVGGGQSIDISLYEPLFGLFGADFLSCQLTGEEPQPKGNELPYVVPRNNYQTKDAKWVTMSCSSEKSFERLMGMIGRTDMLSDPRYAKNDSRIRDENRKVVNEIVANWVCERDLDQVLKQCSELGITIGPIYSMKDIAQDEHYIKRKSFMDVEDPATGVNLKIPNLSFQLMNTPGKIKFTGLPHGVANEVILKDVLGYTDDQIKAAT